MQAKLSKNAMAQKILRSLERHSIDFISAEGEYIGIDIHGKEYRLKRGQILHNELNILKKLNVNAKSKR